MNPSKKSVAIKLRTLARDWSMTGMAAGWMLAALVVLVVECLDLI